MRQFWFKANYLIAIGVGTLLAACLSLPLVWQAAARRRALIAQPLSELELLALSREDAVV
jgi:hypothetical protein